MIRLWGLKTCDTCRKAMKELAAAGAEAELVDIRDKLDAATLARWLALPGAEALVNRRSTTWRGLSEAERARAESDPAGILLENPSLAKRPVAEAGGRLVVGWDKAALEALTA